MSTELDLHDIPSAFPVFVCTKGTRKNFEKKDEITKDNV